jgi:GNAT superfamily N-acetyltransferase
MQRALFSTGAPNSTFPQSWPGAESNEHGKALGAALLKDPFQRAINAAVTIAGRVVHAVDDDAVRFYEHFGFAPSPNDHRALMILMKDVRVF